MDVSLGPFFDAFGVPATVTPPAAAAIETTAFWVSPLTEEVPSSAPVARRELQRVLVLRRDEVPSCPRGTLIDAPAYGSSVVERWRVDGFDRVEEDHLRVLVIPAPEDT